MRKRTNKVSLEDTVLVARGDQALPTGSLVTTTTAFNLANGQVGVMSYDPNSTVKPLGQYLVAGDDSAEVQAIKVVCGTPKSGATQTVSLWEDGDLAKQESGIIRRGQIDFVSVKKASFGKYGAQSVSNFPQPADNGEYGIYLTLDSARTDKAYGMNNDTYTAYAPVTDFTAQGITNKRSFVLENLVGTLNANSRAVVKNGIKGKKDFVVFGVKVAGGSGVVIGTLTPTTDIPFERVNNVDQVIRLNEAGLSALADVVVKDAAITATSTIEKVNLSSLGTSDLIDAIIIVGLEHELTAVYDDQPQVMVSPRVSLTDSWYLTATDPIIYTVNADEAINAGRLWYNDWRLRSGLNVHTRQNRPMGDFFAEGLSYIDTNKRYTSYIVKYYDTESTLVSTEDSPKRLVILLPSEKLSTFVVNVNNIITRINASQTPIPFVTSNDAGTGTASANTVAGLEAVLSAWLEHSRTTAGSFTVTGDAVAGGVYLS